MAEQPDDIEVVAKQGGKRKTWLYISLGVLLVALVAAGALWQLSATHRDGTDADRPAPRAAAIYHAIDTPFTVNFSEQSDGAVRYLQVKMKVMARDQKIIDAFRLHQPAMQHELLMLLYSQNYDDLQGSEGSTALQQACRETINRVLLAEEQLDNGIEAVYFTSFLMQ